MVAGAPSFGCEGDMPAVAQGPERLTSDVGTDDVSFLYPLAVPHAQRVELLGTTTAGPRGPLLPRDLYDGLPGLDVLTPNGDLYTLFRVVSVRIDPCFPGLGVADEGACKNQVRLVMQPVLPKPGSGLTTQDLALHLFYTVTRPELSRLLAEVVEVRASNGVGPYGGNPRVHPVLAAGLAGAGAKALREALLGVAGRSTLTRVTFMGLEHVGLAWRFGGFDVDGKRLVPITIPSAGTTVQSFVNRDIEGKVFEAAEAFPSTESMAKLGLFFDRKRLEAAAPDELTSALQALYRVESPKAHSPDTVDCVSCHVAHAAESYAASVRPLVGAEAERYVSPRGEALASDRPFATNELRAFGYFGDRASVSPRVSHETAEVVAHVNRAVKGAP
jgi:hypothetical protein